MDAVRFHATGGPDVLALETVPDPSPRPDELLVETRAIGVNPTEVYSRTGSRSHPLPRIPGSDFAGVVSEVGESVDRFAAGDRVFGTGLQNDRQGTYAELVVARENRVARLPSSVSFEVGAGAGVVGTTAWLAFVSHARLTPTSTCLVHGGSGGLGHVAVQIAALSGATVVSTAGDEDGRAFVRRQGATHVFDYDDPDLRSKVRDVTTDGVDVVLDHRVGEYLQFDLDVLAPDGTVVVVGGPGDEATITDLWSALRTDATIQVFAMSNSPHLGGVLDEVATLLASETLHVHIAKGYSLSEAAEAQRAVMEDSFVGKLVLRP